MRRRCTGRRRGRSGDHLRRHVYPTFGDRPTARLGAPEVHGWVSRLSETLAPATVRCVYSYVAVMFRAAVEDRLISASRVRGSRCLRSQLLRQGETLGVTVDRIDFRRPTLTVHRQLVVMPGAGQYLARLSTRTIPLPSVVVDALAAHPAEEREIEFRAGSGTQHCRCALLTSRLARRDPGPRR